MKKTKENDNIIQGRWWKIKKNINETIIAKYDKIRDWVMDPKGYFLIHIDREKEIIRVAYCTFSKLGNNPIHDMQSEIIGKTSIEIVNTLIRKKYISTLQHAADMGIELHKAEIALKYNIKYIQDKEIKLR
tara:strand:+ start:761 stop:1153 length:393 start_codon:yes stop_codon:yes gene_type:complete